GLIVLEATAVHPSGLLTSHTLGGYLPQIVDGYRRVAAAVGPHGTRLFVQLLHGGREQIATPPRAPALAPSPVPSPRFRAEPRSASPAEIEELVAGYARCAELAAEAELAGVEVSAAHRRVARREPLPRRGAAGGALRGARAGARSPALRRFAAGANDRGARGRRGRGLRLARARR